ncbi:MAG: N-acetyltransferase [Verrucomicrobiaceae bacterium]|nr:MAG: N-acetyltransferase [Verrucomicrobiaceae bacterium]
MMPPPSAAWKSSTSSTRWTSSPRHRKRILPEPPSAMARFRLEKAAASDKTALFAIHELLFKDQITKVWGWDGGWQRANFDEEWERVETLVIRDETGLAGYLQKERHPDHIYVLNLALLPGSQGNGIGGEVMGLLKEEARTLGKCLRLSVFHINERALAFYLRHGFHIRESTATGLKLVWPGP